MKKKFIKINNLSKNNNLNFLLKNNIRNNINNNKIILLIVKL